MLKNIDKDALIQAFVENAESHANKTRNIRIAPFSNWKLAGTLSLEEDVRKDIEHIIPFMQTIIDAGELCDKQNEFLIIYNFQKASVEIAEQLCCEVACVTRSLDEIKNSYDVQGIDSKNLKNVSLKINMISGEVMNDAQLLLASGEFTSQDLSDLHLESPKSYGFYKSIVIPQPLETSHEKTGMAEKNVVEIFKFSKEV